MDDLLKDLEGPNVVHVDSMQFAPRSDAPAHMSTAVPETYTSNIIRRPTPSNNKFSSYAKHEEDHNFDNSIDNLSFLKDELPKYDEPLVEIVDKVEKDHLEPNR